ncbi:MAG: glycosyltransferase family 4 protein [Candidatus Roizmanbacteria bacterium]|nr:glycosyltransferase family 4 protein [Candidatus Roizmanbacteria bacterium]
MKKIAIVSYHFYKTKTRGGETHVVLLSKLLKKMADVTIITTQSKTHSTWKNEITKKVDSYQGIKIVRHPVDFQIAPRKIVDFNHFLLRNKNHNIDDEILWIKKIGPYSNSLFKYLKRHKTNFDIFIFIGYANPITYFGLPLVNNKSFLIPLLHKEPKLYFKIFNRLFSQPKWILPSTSSELQLIEKRFPGHSPLRILGINPEEINMRLNSDSNKKFQTKNPYILFIGRTEPYKGIYELIEYFNQFIKNNYIKLDLIIIGEKIFPIKTGKNIIYLGIVSQSEKTSFISNSLFLVNPSWYESLSLTLLEAWQQKKPVLVSENCEVLKDQVHLSKGGLYYNGYFEFEKKIKLLLNDARLRKTLGVNGYLFYKKNYSALIIKKKLRKILGLSDRN